jgi:hypothetical protein
MLSKLTVSPVVKLAPSVSSSPVSVMLIREKDWLLNDETWTPINCGFLNVGEEWVIFWDQNKYGQTFEKVLKYWCFVGYGKAFCSTDRKNL